MSGRLIEDPDLELEGDSLESALVADDGSSGKQTVVKPAANDPAPDGLTGDDVPDKYQGKTARQLLDIVTNQESLIGRHSTELGTLRGQVDRALQLRNPGDVSRDEPEKTPLTEEDFLTNPTDATRRTVQSETAELRGTVTRLEAQAEGHQFDVRYPSAATDINDPKFVEFIQRSPTRHQLAQTAFGDSQNLDYGAAGELWALYEDYKSFQPKEAEEVIDPEQITEGKPTAEASTVPARKAPELVSGPNTSNKSPDGTINKRIYSQAALNRLQEKNPDVYWATDTQAQITLAHKEGRVKQDV